MDIALPDGSGIDAIRDVLSESHCTKIVVLSGLTDDVELGRCIEAGAAAVVNKSVDLAEFLATLRRVADGSLMLTAAETSQRLGALAAARDPNWRGRVVGAHLTAREHEVMQQLADGAETSDIAARLHISPYTARTHVRNLLAKLNVSSRLAAVAEAGRLGLLQPSHSGPEDAPLRTSI